MPEARFDPARSHGELWGPGGRIGSVQDGIEYDTHGRRLAPEPAPEPEPAKGPPTLLQPDTLHRMLALARTAPAGAFVEVGVYQGGSAWHLAALAREQGRALHLFDTFAGTPVADAIDSHRIGDFADTSVEAVRACIPDAALHQGVFPASLPPGLGPIAFVHADCDQYASVRAVIERLAPHLVPDGVIVFDDYQRLEGATRAVDELLGEGVEAMPGGGGYWRKPALPPLTDRSDPAAIPDPPPASTAIAQPPLVIDDPLRPPERDASAAARRSAKKKAAQARRRQKAKKEPIEPQQQDSTDGLVS